MFTGEPSLESQRRARKGRSCCLDRRCVATARNADVLYTDIWVSMGKEAEEARREAELGPYWINDSAVKLANP